MSPLRRAIAYTSDPHFRSYLLHTMQIRGDDCGSGCSLQSAEASACDLHAVEVSRDRNRLRKAMRE
jgi:uncharacterized ParB-like nuclease family protein